MLVLRRKAGESVVVAGTITVFILVVEGERVKIGINAPPDVSVVRAELGSVPVVEHPNPRMSSGRQGKSE